MTIPEHVSRNYHNTEDKLAVLEALLSAAYHMVSEADITPSPDVEAFFVLMDLAREKNKEARRAHLAEWVGHGGNSDALSQAEIAAARGADDRGACG